MLAEALSDFLSVLETRWQALTRAGEKQPRSSPVHDPEKQSACQPGHPAYPKALEREKAPGITGTSSVDVHSGIHKLPPLQRLLDYLNFYALIVGRGPQPAQHGS